MSVRKGEGEQRERETENEGGNRMERRERDSPREKKMD